jgi:hypothetical protein
MQKIDYLLIILTLFQQLKDTFHIGNGTKHYGEP